MVLSVNTNVGAMLALQNLGKTNMAMEKTQLAITTGLRVSGQGDDAIFRVDSGEAAEAAGPTGAAGAVAGVGALLALQEMPDATEQRRQAVHRSNDILDELDQLRLGLLTGSVPRQRLQRLVKLLRERPGGYADPQLDHIIADIELRAAVELAKLEMTEGRRN